MTVTAFLDLGCDQKPSRPVIALHTDGRFEIEWDGRKVEIPTDKMDELAHWLPTAVDESEYLKRSQASSRP